MEDRYDIGVDTAEGKDKGVKYWIRIGDDGKYIPATVIDTTTTISFADSVQRSGYVGVESGEYACSAEIVDENKSEEERVLDKISCLGAQICEILRQINGHYHVEITENSVNLYPEGTNLYYSE